MNEEPKTRLHFMRARARGGAAFWDPQTDVRTLLPVMAELALDVLDQITPDEGLRKEYKYLTKCFRVFQIKIREDNKDLVTLVNQFQEAICKASFTAIAKWSSTVMILMTTMYALFDRRDIQADGKETRAMLNTAKVSALVAALPPELMKQVAEVYRLNGELLEDDYVPKHDGEIHETSRDEIVLTDVKKLACILIDHDGSDDWEDIAKACDAYYQSPEREKQSDMNQLAVALAYPTYESPFLEAYGDADAEST